LSASWPFDDHDRSRIAEVLDEAVPGSVALGAVDYLERLLTALDHDPPRIWAAPPGSDGDWLAMGPWERQAWESRIDELRSRVARVVSGEAGAQDLRAMYVAACEATYGDPAYGGNRNGAGWRKIGFPDPIFPPARMGEVSDGTRTGSHPETNPDLDVNDGPR